jgi:hypothetical protein
LVRLGGSWNLLLIGWIRVTAIWAVATAWLAGDREPGEPPAPPKFLDAMRTQREIELVRFAMCAAAISALAALQWGPHEAVLPLAALAFAFGWIADRPRLPTLDQANAFMRRALAVVLVFNYVCLAWIFFRASSFDTALAVLRQLGNGETGAANVSALVTMALAVGFIAHFFADGSFRWLRDRFCELPPPAQGFVLAAAVLILRELGSAKLVPFIYFQF